jgi:uncharacterized protein with WD repeat
MKLILAIWLSLMSFAVNAQTIEGYSDNCVIYLNVQHNTNENIKSIEIQYSPNGFDFISFDKALIDMPKQQYSCLTKNEINYFRLKTVYVNGDCDFSPTIKIVNSCDVVI